MELAAIVGGAAARPFPLLFSIYRKPLDYAGLSFAPLPLVFSFCLVLCFLFSFFVLYNIFLLAASLMYVRPRSGWDRSFSFYWSVKIRCKSFLFFGLCNIYDFLSIYLTGLSFLFASSFGFLFDFGLANL